MVFMSTRRANQPLLTFRLDERSAKAFRDKCSLEGTPQQVVLETLVRAFVDGNLPDVRQLRLAHAQRIESEQNKPEE
jgi:hypothetical protein